MFASPAFPKTYQAISLDKLFTAYRSGPERIRRSLNGLDETELSSRPRGVHKWSMKEVAIHVCDSELVGSVRFRMVLAQQGAILPFYDQDLWTRNLGRQSAGNAELEDSLILFECLRRTTARLLDGLVEADWNRTGTHAEFGSVTLRNLMELYADHSERHLAQILEMRTLLHRPRQIPLILEERLY